MTRSPIVPAPREHAPSSGPDGLAHAPAGPGEGGLALAPPQDAGLPDHALPGEPLPARGTVVLSSVSSDSHTWNLAYLQLLLEELGWHVVNLGACTPDDIVIDACLRHQPDLLVISSVNGHGRIDGARLAAAVRRRPELHSVPAIIGGKLGLAGQLAPDQVHGLLEAGFHAVFQDGADMHLFTGYVAAIGASRRAVTP
ncbi:MAG TPA: cobalamin-dependent protein [Actinocrinis sp.]|nr:cobalamin-dependent protein [Actinocrinis sp.]